MSASRGLTRPGACSGSVAFLCSSSLILLEFRIDFLRIQVAVQIAVHHHSRGMIAAAETYDGQQREALVRRRFAKLDSQTLVEMFPHSVVARDPTTHAVADHNDVTAHGLAKNKVVKRRHAIHVRGRHAEMSGNFTNALIGNPAAVPLHNL